MGKKSYGVEIKIIMSLVNLLPRTPPVRSVTETTPQEAESLCVRAAAGLGGKHASAARPARRSGQVKTSGAPTLALTLGGQSFTFSSAGHLHPAGHAMLFYAFLIDCRGALLALASKTIEANGLRLGQYYPIITEAPEGGALR